MDCASVIRKNNMARNKRLNDFRLFMQKMMIMEAKQIFFYFQTT